MSSKIGVENRIMTVARLWPKYEGRDESRAGVIMGLDRNRFRTICIYLGRWSGKSNFFEEKGFKTYYISNGKLRFFNVLVVLKLAKVLKQEGVDIIHCHKHKAAVYGTIAAVLAHTPVVIAHVHGLDRTRNRTRRILNYFLMKRVNKVLTVGEAVRKDVLNTNPSIPPEKVISLGNSIDYARFADVSITRAQARQIIGLPGNSLVFGTVGRMAPNKGQIYLLRAFTKVKESISSAHLVLIGDGRLRNDFEQQAAGTSCADSIHFLGHRDNIPELLRAMDVFVLSSIGGEGIPRALLEAMASGVLVVGTEVGGIPEILAGGEFGYLTPPRDSDALAKAMVELAQKPPQEREKLLEKAKRRVQNEYVYEVVVQRLEKIYAEQVNKCNKL
jgi:glycosyltransferase involved in cell wall biosynthesis